MFGSDHYVPLLRAKQAEFNGLRDLDAGAKAGLTPFIELPAMAWDPDDEEDGAAGGLDPALAGLPRKVERAWGTDRPFFLEMGLVPSSAAIGGGQHPVDALFDLLRNDGLQAIPVTAPGRDQDFQDAVGRAIAADGRGVCIRLDADDFADPGASFQDARDLLNEFGVQLDVADLLIDFAEIPSGQTGSMSLAGRAVLQAIPDPQAWRTITWAGTAFPNVQNFQANTVNTAPRSEWAVWRSLIGSGLPRDPAFGDYTVNGIQSSYDQSAAYFRSSPNLRYSTDTDFIVMKARHPRHGHDQFNDLCRSMVGRPEYRGAGFSAGDAYIDRCAQNADGPGNAVSWRQTGVNHHLTTVVDQVANLP